MIDLSTRYQASDDVVAREVGGECVLLNLTSGTYFGLNPVGSRVWQIIDGSASSLATVCDLLEDEFDVERGQLEADVQALAEKLLASDLVVALP